jgi:hypothetical protein
MPDSHALVHTSYDDLVRYIQGRLEPKRLAAIDPHLVHCDICRERLSLGIGSQMMLHLVEKAKADRKRERSEPRFSSGSEAIVQNLSPLSLDRQKVQIIDISKKGLGILAAKDALPGTIMQVRINTAVELAEVRHCSACEGGYRIGLRFIAVSDEREEPFSARPGTDLQLSLEPQPDRRQAQRQQLVQSVEVSVLGTDQLLHGVIRNLSEGGAQILLEQPLRVPSSVKIQYAGKLVAGEVVYCRQEQTGWLLGIHLVNASSGIPDRSNVAHRSR